MDTSGLRLGIQWDTTRSPRDGEDAPAVAAFLAVCQGPANLAEEAGSDPFMEDWRARPKQDEDGIEPWVAANSVVGVVRGGCSHRLLEMLSAKWRNLAEYGWGRTALKSRSQVSCPCHAGRLVAPGLGTVRVGIVREGHLYP